ncbi:MAG: MATE family efflux transporter [Deltaproteobacteria bacterium]|jgi:MATE family multidrug resistance protein|nr:MATE family efflux transporter [Deltaproteobacteria bacterium]
MFFQTFLRWILNNIKELNPKTRWNAPQGYKEVLSLALPLLASTAASSLMLFTDRIFLSNYSPNAIAASLPAGMAKVAVTSLFIGICSYVGIFVAQYIGAGKPHRAAATLWQGLYFSIVTGLLVSLLYFANDFIFSFGSQNPEIIELELSYFNVLILFTPVDLAMVVMSSFMSAMGRAKTVMWVSLIGAGFNIPMNYLLIFGLKVNSFTIFPQWGIFGAAVATAMSWVLSVAIYSFMIFTKKMERDFQVRSNRKFDPELTFRILKFGWPGGLQFFMEIFAFGFFSFAVGHLSDLELTCNNIVFSLEALSFFPMIGVGMAVSILVGQSIGRGKPLEGARSTKSGTVLSTIYVMMMGCLFLTIPRPLLSLFLASDLDPATMGFIYDLGTVILVYVAFYSFFDGLYLCCFGAIKGAGDVWFPMGVMAVWGIFGLIAPVLLLFKFDVASIHTMWYCMMFYICGSTLTGVWRYKQGKWKSMRVIERVIDTPTPAK